jgi:hypothetical protein
LTLPAPFLALQSDLPVAAVGSRVDRGAGNGRLVVIADPEAASGQVGVAFLAAMFGGHRHVFGFWIGLGTAEVLRIEVHGNVSRMNKIVAHLGRDGSVLLQGEEIDAVVVVAKDGGLQVEITFRAYSSAVEWIYLFGREIGSAQGAAFTCADVSLQPLPETDPAPIRRHSPVKTVDGASVICQSFTVLNNTFSLTFEIHKPGSQLVGLGLMSDLDLAFARWWTWELQGLEPRPGELVAGRPVLPIRSPGLMDRFGPDHANHGHAISGVFADWHDLDRMSTPEADRRADLTLRARFDCGTVIDLPLAKILTTPEAPARSEVLFARHCAAELARASEPPVFLEVGARGPASAQVRRRVTPDWRYVGLDYMSDQNVDIVGDAHRLTDCVARGSVDLVFSSEVMEHLLSPLRFVLEANRVLKPGGLFIARMPTIWPLHAEPWDFWRITVHGWTSLLNANTGFQILDRCEDGRASVVPHLPEQGSGLTVMAAAPAPMLTMVVARKIGEVPQDTSGWSADLASGSYDHA